MTDTLEATETPTIPIAHVIVKNRKRPADPTKVAVLAGSMHEVGMLNPITLDDDNHLIAGFHRLVAAKKMGWTDVPYRRQSFDKLQAELAEIDENLVRNELDELQRGQWIRRREEIQEKLDQRARSGEKGSKKRTTAENAAELGMGKRSYQQHKQIADKLAEDVQEKLAGTPIAQSTTQLLNLAQQPAEKQREVLAMIDAGTARDVRDATRQLRKVELGAVKLPEGKYHLITPDMPWQYENDGARGAAENHYPTMGLEEMLAMDIGSLFAELAVCFMWVTKDHMREAFVLLDHWGLEMKFEFIWNKPNIGNGSWGRNRHEKLWLCAKGDSMTPAWLPPEGSVFDWPRGRHSAKPDEAYEMMVKMYPHLDQRLELFARAPRPGFVTFGNEVGKAVDEPVEQDQSQECPF